MTEKIKAEDFIKAFGGGVKHKMISISKEEIRDKMFFVREEDSDQPIVKEECSICGFKKGGAE